FEVYVEYAGEDTSHGRNYLLGNSALSVGIHFPRLWERFDVTYEASEWQNSWYQHFVYKDGMTNYGHVTGNWGADNRLPYEGAGAQEHMLRVGYQPGFGGLAQFTYRTLQNQQYGFYPYKRFQEFSLAYSRPWKEVTVGGELDAGRDSFGASFTR